MPYVEARHTVTPDCSASLRSKHRIPHLSASTLSLSSVSPCRHWRKHKCSLLTLFIPFQCNGRRIYGAFQLPIRNAVRRQWSQESHGLLRAYIVLLP